MQEYLVHCQGTWWHFFMKAHYGLCFRKKESGRFSGFEVLYPEGCLDFAAAKIGESIHLVCQNQSGGLVYLSFTDEVWHKTLLLESKSNAPYPKHFSLVPVGKFLNLFYVIAYQDKYMLVHQIPGLSERPPVVVDRLLMETPPFVAVNHKGSDISVCYKNESGVSGCRVYRWSAKTFGQFVPVNPALGCTVKNLMIETGDRVRYAALKPLDGVMNLVCFQKDADGRYKEAVTVNLDCPEAVPVFGQDGERLYLSWYESGSIMSSYSTDGGEKWSKPMRYMKGSSVNPVLYGIWDEDGFRQAYGYEKDQEIVLYADEGLSDKTKTRRNSGFRPAGHEAEAFAREMGQAEKAEPIGTDPIFEMLRKEISAAKEQLLILRQSYADVVERLERLEQAK